MATSLSCPMAELFTLRCYLFNLLSLCQVFIWFRSEGNTDSVTDSQQFEV